MYGGGFATVPAYLADMFGTLYVGAIHGLLLTAWSAAGILGLVIVNYVREFEIAAGGVFYTAGITFHLARMRFQEAIWHCFVLAAAACHYAAVVRVAA
jgi:channel protein (hemolysin III family)